MNGTYDLSLVVASYCVAAFAAYAALDLGGRIALFDGARERFWLFAGALAMGTGIWAMHFVGMKAFKLPVEISYDLGLTALSWFTAVAVSLLALYVISRSTLTTYGLVAGALLMGGGICLMHFSGMWAMLMTPAIHYAPLLTAASVAIAVLASAAALFISFSVRRLPQGRVLPAKIAAALIMALAICGTHYTAMAGARFSSGALCAAGNLLVGDWMGLPLALITAGLLVAVLLLARMDARAVSDRRRADKRRIEAERVRRLAYYDTVTGLPNRSLFNETLLRQLINVNGRTPPPFAVVYGEIRGYRALVEKLGQDRVNLLLKTVAGQMAPVLREGDLLARLSHDSFIFLLRHNAERSIDTALAQVGALLNAAVPCDSQNFKLVWGIGSSRYPDNGNSTQALIRAAMKLQREIGSEAKPALRAPVSVLGAA
ncbi:MAG: diguanylate cyclase [Nevskia sp.]|nr:diguanylate cyclase [Nevskia sp.]